MYGDQHVVGRSFLGVVPYRHYGIELPDGTMCENSPPGVRITTYEGFTRGRPARVTGPDLTPAERDLAVQRALSRVGERRYSLTANNCEHFATWCATGIAISQQVIDWIRNIGDVVRAFMAAAVVACAVSLALAE
jgi:Lecithin retinol acyltransferase